MSVIGPRPTLRYQVEQYDSRQRHRLDVKPGITGWAQVNGLRGETETLEKMRARIEYDLSYLRNWSLQLDLQIVLKTILVVLRSPDAY